MGRKKKRNKAIIFCYYCDRQFESERVLIQHQRAKHFKCPQCHKRISSAHGMMVHVFQVHKETIEKVPAAKEGRDSFDIEIFGMDGVPQNVIDAKRLKVYGEVAVKKMKLNHPSGNIVIPGAPSTMGQIIAPAPMHPMMVGMPYGMYGQPMARPMPMRPPMPPPGGMQPMQPVPGMPPRAHMPRAMPPPPSGPMIPHGMPPGGNMPAPPPGGVPHGVNPNAGPGMAPPPGRQMAAPPPAARPFIPAPQVTAGQPFGGYAQPMAPPPAQQPPPMLQQQQQQHQPPPMPVQTHQPPPVATMTKKKNVLRVYEDEVVSMEEKRAMHPKYSAHLNKRIASLSTSIEARIQLLAQG